MRKFSPHIYIQIYIYIFHSIDLKDMFYQCPQFLSSMKRLLIFHVFYFPPLRVALHYEKLNYFFLLCKRIFLIERGLELFFRGTIGKRAVVPQFKRPTNVSYHFKVWGFRHGGGWGFICWSLENSCWIEFSKCLFLNRFSKLSQYNPKFMVLKFR